MATTNVFTDVINIIGVQDLYKNHEIKHKLERKLIEEIPFKFTMNNKFHKKLQIEYGKERYFNCLEIDLNTTKQFSEIFQEISFYIGKNKITSFDNEEYLIILKKLKMTTTNDFLFQNNGITLPFLFKENKMYDQDYGKIEIELKTKIILNENDIKLNGFTYIRTEKHETFENKMIQLQKHKEILEAPNNSWFNYFYPQIKEVKIDLHFNHPSYLIYIIGEGIKNIKLQINNDVYETTITNLLETNKKNGYDFDFPVIIFEPSLIFNKDAKTINFSRIFKQKLFIEYTEQGQHEFNVYCVNTNILKSMSEMSGLVYSI